MRILKQKIKRSRLLKIVVKVEEVKMFSPTSINDFLKSYKENNPKEDTKNLHSILSATVKSKKDGVVCNQCSQPKDYEIEGVCF